MQIQTFPITVTEEEAGKPHFGAPAMLTAYLLENHEQDPDRVRPAVLVCPGGGYRHLSRRENQAVALQYLAMGYHTFVLEYSLAPNTFPYALMEIAKSVALIREKHSEWKVMKDKIVVSGFSAGGHVALSLGVFWHHDFLSKALHLQPEDIRPDAMLLCYPVITATEKCHPGSFEALLGDQVNDQHMRDFVSLEKQVSEKTPRTFLWHTWTDQAVPVQGSLLFAAACEKAGVNLELHIYPTGRHGLSLATRETSGPDMERAEPQCQSWISLAKEWLASL